MQIYQVGGAVRDRLLGLPVKDHDYVVVGATRADMEALGYRAVGRDFPVFLHPITHEEYALARTERKTGPGHTGFEIHASPNVTLEEDLGRRDLTINAIAEDAQGRLIDPYGGIADLQARQLRHISPAFTEDPLRILRVARFAARFGFDIAESTQTLMRDMVAQGELQYLAAERIWQELARGLMSDTPARLITALRESNALAHLLPEVDALFGVPQSADSHPEIDTGIHTLLALAQAATAALPLPARFAVLVHDVGKGLTPIAQWPHHEGHEQHGVALVDRICTRLRVPNACTHLARLATREHLCVHRAFQLSAEAILNLLERCDAFRQPERFHALLTVCQCDARGRTGFASVHYPQANYLARQLSAAHAIDSGAIARSVKEPESIRSAIQSARLHAIQTGLPHA